MRRSYIPANKAWRKQFGRLFVVRIIPAFGKIAAWAVCKCKCGTRCKIRVHSLVSGNTRSCGCLSRDTGYINGKDSLGRVRKYVDTHEIDTPEYRTLINMKTRCYNTNRPAYKYYGGRGVKIYAPWLDKTYGYINFKNYLLSTIGLRPGPEYSIDRYPDPNGHYEPGNIRWADNKQQADNRVKHMVFITVKATPSNFLSGVINVYGSLALKWFKIVSKEYV